MRQLNRTKPARVVSTAFLRISRGHGVLKKIESSYYGFGSSAATRKTHFFCHIIPPYAAANSSIRLVCFFPRLSGGTPTAALWRVSVAADAFSEEDLDRIHKMIRIFKNSSWPNSPPPFGTNPLLHSVNSSALKNDSTYFWVMS